MGRAQDLQAKIAEMNRLKGLAIKKLAEVKEDIDNHNDGLRVAPNDSNIREAKAKSILERYNLEEDIADFTSEIAVSTRLLNIATGEESKNRPIGAASSQGPAAGRAKAEIDETDKIRKRLKDQEREVLNDIARLKGNNDPDGSKNAAYAALDKIRRELSALNARQSFLKNRMQKQS